MTRTQKPEPAIATMVQALKNCGREQGAELFAPLDAADRRAIFNDWCFVDGRSRTDLTQVLLTCVPHAAGWELSKLDTFASLCVLRLHQQAMRKLVPRFHYSTLKDDWCTLSALIDGAVAALSVPWCPSKNKASKLRLSPGVIALEAHLAQANLSGMSRCHKMRSTDDLIGSVLTQERRQLRKQTTEWRDLDGADKDDSPILRVMHQLRNERIELIRKQLKTLDHAIERRDEQNAKPDSEYRSAATLCRRYALLHNWSVDGIIRLSSIIHGSGLQSVDVFASVMDDIAPDWLL